MKKKKLKEKIKELKYTIALQESVADIGISAANAYEAENITLKRKIFALNLIIHEDRNLYPCSKIIEKPIFPLCTNYNDTMEKLKNLPPVTYTAQEVQELLREQKNAILNGVAFFKKYETKCSK